MHDRFGDAAAAPAGRGSRQSPGEWRFPSAGRRARQQHARDVRARNQQHEADHGQQAGGDRQHRRVGGRDGSERRWSASSESRRSLFVCGFACSQARHQQRQVRARLLDGRCRASTARAGTSSDRRAVRAASCRSATAPCRACRPARLRATPTAGIHSSGARIGTMPLKPAGATPTMVYGIAADADGAADGVRAPTPARASSSDRRPSRPRSAPGTVVLRQERPAERGADAEHLKVVAGDDLAHREARAVVEVQRREHRAVAGDVLEHVVLRLKIEIVRVRGGAERRRTPRRS